MRITVTPDRWIEAGELVGEYIAMTAAGADLHPTLVAERANLATVYAAPGTLLLATADDEPAGCVGLRTHEPGTGLVKRLYVRPAYRRQGIARALMDAVHAHAAEVGYERLVLDVRPERTGAIAFYRGLGYEDIEPYVPLVCLGRVIAAAGGVTPGGTGRRR